MSTKGKATCLIAGVAAGVLGCIFALPWYELSVARKHYPLGMTLQQAKLSLSEPYEVSPYTGNVLPEPPTERQKEIYPLYIVRAQKDGLYLEFNHNEKLIKIDLLSYHK